MVKKSSPVRVVMAIARRTWTTSIQPIEVRRYELFLGLTQKEHAQQSSYVCSKFTRKKAWSAVWKLLWIEVLGDEVLLKARRMSEQIERPPLETFLTGQLAARDCTVCRYFTCWSAPSRYCSTPAHYALTMNSGRVWKAVFLLVSEQLYMY